jgi:hypothetical protein
MSINAQPFNPTFKLIGNLVEDQVLTYDSSENAFVNSTNTGGTAGSGFDAAVNTGTGLGVWSGTAGTTLQFKTLLGGNDITITDNGDALVIASTITETIQTGTNLGTGTGIYDSKDATTHQLKFKSIVAGAGLTLTDDGAGTLTLVNDIAAGTTDADLTLSNLSNVATARTNLDVHSKAEADAIYHKHDDAFVPSVNNTFDIGSSTLKYNDIYAETFQGIAVLADNLTTSGTTGQVLTYNGSSWTAADTSGGTLLGLADVSTVVPNDGQHLVWNTTTSLWTPSASGAGGGGYQDSDARNSISVAGDLSYNATTGVISYTATSHFSGAYGDLTGAPTIPTLVSQLTNDSGFITTDTNTTYTAGAGLTLVGTEFANSAPDLTVALTGSGATTITGTYPNFTIASTDTDTNTTYTAGTNVSISGSNVISATDTNTDTTYTAGTGLTLAGTVFSMSTAHFDGAYGSLTGAPTIPADVSQLTDTTNLLVHVTPFSGAFADLSGVASAVAGDDGKVLYYDHATTSLKWKTDASTPAGYNNTNWDTAFGWGDHSTAGYLTSETAHYSNSDVDTHLNTGTATANQALVWTGTDYDWVTSTDSDTTYTAGTGLSLVGTVFSMTAGHFDGAYGSLTGAPTIPSGNQIIDWTADQGVTNIHAGNYTDTNTTYTAGANVSISGSNVISSTDTNTDTTYTAGSGLTLVGTSFSLSAAHFDGAYASLTGAPTMYANSNVDGHLNTSTATANQVLTWTGTDYDWISSGAHFDGNYSSLVGAPTTVSSFTNDAGYLTAQTDSQTLSLSGTTLAITGGNNVDLGALTIDDMADVNITTVSDGQFLKYDNVSGDWLNETVTIPADVSDLTDTTNLLTHVTPFSGVFADLTSKPTTLSGYGITDGYANSDVDSHIKQSTATTGQVLSWNGSNYVWVTAPTGAHYTDVDARAAVSATTGLSYNSTTGVMTLNASIDALLDVNSTGATLNQVLKWNGSAWSPALDLDTTYTAGTNVSINGSGVISSTDTNTTYVDSDWNHDSLTGVVATEHLDWTVAQGVNIHAGNYTDTNTDTTYTAGANVSISGSNVISATDTNTTYTAGANVSISGSNVISSTDTNTTYVNSDWNHDSLTGFVANEHIDWTTDQGSTNIHAGNYTDTDTIYTTFNTDFDTRLALNGYANSDVDTHLNSGSASASEVLSWNGSDYAWVTNTGSGATDKIEEGNTSVEVIDGGSNGHIMFNINGTDSWQISYQGHILPETDNTVDIGSASKKIRDLFVSENSLHIGDSALSRATGGKLHWDGVDVMSYTNLSNKPTIPAQNTGGTGIQVNAGVVSIDASLDLLSNVSSSAPSSGQVLKWSGSEWAPAADLTSGSSAMNDLSDVDTSGITTGQYLQWNGTSFVASTVSGGGASAINDLSDVDTTTSAPSNGDVLTWVTADSEWAPQASSGGGSGSSVEYFKLNYATTGNLTSITNATSGLTATILSATGGDVEISFSGSNYPPAGILIYGYAYASNEYVIMPLNKDIGTRKIAGGGSSGSPIAFGSMGSVDLTIKLREADTGSSRSFGTTTHAWIMFTMV